MYAASSHPCSHGLARSHHTEVIAVLAPVPRANVGVMLRPLLICETLLVDLRRRTPRCGHVLGPCGLVRLPLRVLGLMCLVMDLRVSLLHGLWRVVIHRWGPGPVTRVLLRHLGRNMHTLVLWRLVLLPLRHPLAALGVLVACPAEALATRVVVLALHSL